MNLSKSIKEDFINLLVQKYNHKEIPNSSLIPVNDPSVLFTTAGMHPLVVYLLGELHPLGQRLVNVQRCFRTNDIEEVGDTIHHTLFEMLGYWSLGDYFKELSLEITFDYFVNKLKFDPKRLYSTVFVGNTDVELDRIAIEKWKELYRSVGIEPEVWDGKDFNENTRIFPLLKTENWWGPAGETGPCGPDSELFYWRGKEKPDFRRFVPWDTSNMFIEISNNVFMGYNKTKEKTYVPLVQKNIDFGGGFERITLISQFKESDGSLDMKYSVYDTELFDTQRTLLEELSGKSFQDSTKEEIKNLRIILDHMRGIIFLLTDGVIPSNKDRGYILRRLIRRVMRSGKVLGIEKSFIIELGTSFFETYKLQYTHFESQLESICEILSSEIEKFNKTLDKGLRKIEELSEEKEVITGRDLFYIFETYGFPCELSLEALDVNGKDRLTIIDDFNECMRKHQELSRNSSIGKFKGGLSDSSEETTKLHTLQHLLLRTLQLTISDEIHQKGSNITPERLRLDINLDRKITQDEIQTIELTVSEKINEGISVDKFDLPKNEAERIGAEHEFGQKYPDTVSVFVIGLRENVNINDASRKDYLSAEFCGGPHVQNTNEIVSDGKRFKILNQEKIGSGILRIKASLV